MRLLTTTALAALAVLTVFSGRSLDAQERMKPAVPGAGGDPVWQGILKTPDGRTFVTDGGLVIDVALARPASLPSRQLPPKVLQDYFSSPHTDEYGLGDLKAAATGKTFTAPNGIPVSATYVAFLRRVLPRTARLRFGGAMKPIVVVDDGKPVGAFMPVAQ